MSRTADDIPVLSEWLSATSRKSASQYAVTLRPFLRSVDVAEVQSTDLVAFVLAQPTRATRRKAFTALVAFFGDLTDQGRIARDPAHRLSERVREAEVRINRRDALLATGITDSMLRDLRWDSVLSHLIDKATNVPGSRVDLPDAPVVVELETEMLRQLGGLSTNRFRELMNKSVT